MISIILPTFNRSHILTSTINNVMAQTFTEYELIIINDASSDNTEKIIQNLQSQDSRIQYIKNEKNIGTAGSRKIGYQQSTRGIIVFLDDDDTWNKEKLMKQYNLLKHTNYDMVISDYYIKQYKQLTYKNMQPFGSDFKNQILKFPGPFFQSIMIRKKIIDKMEAPFDSNAVPSEDWDFFIELAKLNIQVGHIAEPLFTWNINHDNQSLNLEKEALALEYILEKHNTYFQENINKNILSNHYRRIARLYEKIYLINGNAKQIAKFYKKAFQINPLSIKNIFYRINMIAGYQYTRCLINSLRKIRGVPNA